jgi:peptidoglycan hydrolase CwlO-like protein
MQLYFMRAVMLLCFSLALLILAPQQTHGQTQPSSQSKPQSSTLSDEHLTTWERLSMRFETTLQQHEQTLTKLSQKLKASEYNGQRLTDLLSELSKQNENLKNYNRQIAERMQERDEDLASAYDQIDKQKKRWLKALLAIIVMAALIVGFIAVKVLQVLRVIPL